MTKPEATSSGRFPETPFERIQKLFQAGERIWARSEHHRGAYPDVSNWDYWFWMNWHGPAEAPELADLFYPEPPAHLVHRVVGEAASPQVFREGGLVDWRRIRLSLADGGVDLDRSSRILDFGCGCGRILRHFARYAGSCELVGADVDRGAIAWCREALDFASFELLPHEPPSDFPDGRFDAIYSYSVFSHLPERLGRRWLEELHRITRPGAIVVLTIQGRRVIDRMIARDSPSDVPSAARLRRDLLEILEKGFAFYPYGKLDLKDERNRSHFDEFDLEQYGVTFVLPKHIFASWGDLFNPVLLSFGPDDWQDYVILRRLPDR